MVASYMRMFPPSVTNLCLCLIKVIVLALSRVCFSITATYLSWCSFKYLCVLCCWHVYLSLLRCVWEWRRYTTQYRLSLSWANPVQTIVCGIVWYWQSCLIKTRFGNSFRTPD